MKQIKNYQVVHSLFSLNNYSLPKNTAIGNNRRTWFNQYIKNIKELICREGLYSFKMYYSTKDRIVVKVYKGEKQTTLFFDEPKEDYYKLLTLSKG